MNTQSVSPANAALAPAPAPGPGPGPGPGPAQQASTSVRVWDAPVRVFHWLMVLCFAGAYLTAESEHWRLLHVTLGYSMAALVVFRILWGVIGTRYARFTQFVRGPQAIKRYLGALFTAQPEHHTGHNPAGALAILGLLGLTLAIALSGWALYNSGAGEAFEDLHEVLANAMLALVGLHVAAVLLTSWRHRENLVAAMITGRKRGLPGEGIGKSWRIVAVLLLAGVLGFGWLQWQSAPAAGAAQDAPAAGAAQREHDD